ncbi:hypothetical protein DSO57_1021014 [Entomophthora muscae]|uniref:Uncharacterized protein n=1 Tax=Entomophthora muscae TaxID=34485 RepID=A0ACC2S5F6_9FUNG|nr:hypothetical protein DSO57_1021014 [Entomophthora muscae]
MKHCHFYLPEQAPPGSAALKTLSQDPCPASDLFANLNPAKIEEAKPHGLKALVFYEPLVQIDPILSSLSDLSSPLRPSRQSGIPPSRDQSAVPHQALYRPPEASFGPVHFTKYPPNPAYLEYNLGTILIENPLARTRETEYIGCKGKRIRMLSLLFKDKYNYLPAYFIPMTLPLTLKPDHIMDPPTAVRPHPINFLEYSTLLWQECTHPLVGITHWPNGLTSSCQHPTLKLQFNPLRPFIAAC